MCERELEPVYHLFGHSAYLPRYIYKKGQYIGKRPKAPTTLLRNAEFHYLLAVDEKKS
jgi:hypothetical protein